jgi:hypothetical protein
MPNEEGVAAGLPFGIIIACLLFVIISPSADDLPTRLPTLNMPACDGFCMVR